MFGFDWGGSLFVLFVLLLGIILWYFYIYRPGEKETKDVLYSVHIIVECKEKLHSLEEVNQTEMIENLGLAITFAKKNLLCLRLNLKMKA